MLAWFARWAALCAVIAALPAGGRAQQLEQVDETLGVFLDCQTFFCDFDHFRREITFVNWMRDQRDADVHLLITAQQTGGGGWEFTLAFIGRERFAGREDTLRYTSINTDTDAEIRDGLTQSITLGLVRYVARTPIGRRLQITLPEAAEEAVQQARPEDDPWNFWTFRTRVGGNLGGESQRRSFSFNGSVSANRVTEALKLELTVSGFKFRREVDVAELDTTFVNTRDSWSASPTVVWSVGPHWSLGVQGRVSASTFVNQDLALTTGPTIEYNIYPYSESTRRQIVFRYSAGFDAFDYEEVTVFGKISEVRPSHELVVASAIQQPWGSINMAVSASQFLDDLSQHNVNLSGGFTLRVVRGLELNVLGSVSRIKDQLYLRGGGLTPDEILLQQQQLGTDFRYSTFFSFGYRFGSKFANVVNPRMEQSGGGVFFF